MSRNLFEEIIKNGSLEDLKQYVESGEDVNRYSFFFGKPLDVAMRKNRINMAKYLVSKGATVNEYHLWLAIENKHLNPSFLEKYFQLYPQEDEKRKLAIENNDEEAKEQVREKIFKFFDQIHKNEEQAVKDGFLIAGNLELVKLFVENGAEIEKVYPDKITCNNQEIKNYLTEMKPIQRKEKQALLQRFVDAVETKISFEQQKEKMPKQPQEQKKSEEEQLSEALNYLGINYEEYLAFKEKNEKIRNKEKNRDGK